MLLYISLIAAGNGCAKGSVALRSRKFHQHSILSFICSLLRSNPKDELEFE